MADFDPMKALREEIIGLSEVHKIVQARTRASEAAMAEAEAEHNAAVKLDAFLKGMLSDMQGRMRKLEEEAERKAQT